MPQLYKHALTQKGSYTTGTLPSSKPTVYTLVVEKTLKPNRLRAQKRSPHDNPRCITKGSRSVRLCGWAGISPTDLENPHFHDYMHSIQHPSSQRNLSQTAPFSHTLVAEGYYKHQCGNNINILHPHKSSHLRLLQAPSSSVATTSTFYTPTRAVTKGYYKHLQAVWQQHQHSTLPQEQVVRSG